jgi:tetratricopeptide (TPR) repeat protein
MRRGAWNEAIARYREAIERLHGAGQDDEREADLWLRLATVTSASGTAMEVAECCRRAITLAERAGSFDLLAWALARFQDATNNAPGNYAGHREAAELIEAALARAPAGESAGRALLLAASARPLSAAGRPEDERHVTGRLAVAGEHDAEIVGRLREAVAMARRVQDDDVLAYALRSLRVHITSPDTLDERLELTREMGEANMKTGNPVSIFEAHLFRHEDLLEAGDIDGARIEARAMRRLGESIGADGIVTVALSLLATHETADGALDEARRLLFESRNLDAQQGNNSNSQFRFGLQLLMLRWHQGRIAELQPAYRRAVDTMPRVAAIRALLALICAESGQIDEARAELDVLASGSVTEIQKDYQWWLTMVCMSRVAVATGARDLAGELYELLRPYADRNASTASAASFGSASLFLGQLAVVLGDRNEAERHYERALSFNIRTRQRVWAARARLHFAEMLLARGGDEDLRRANELMRVAQGDAREICMAGLQADVAALMSRAPPDEAAPTALRDGANTRPATR